MVRNGAAIFLFTIALLCGLLLHIGKLRNERGDAGAVYDALRSIYPHLKPGQKLHLYPGSEAGLRLMQARLALAPCNLFLAKPGERPDTLLCIEPSPPDPPDRSIYRELVRMRSGGIHAAVFERVR